MTERAASLMRPPRRQLGSFGTRTVSTTLRRCTRWTSKFTHDGATGSRLIQIFMSKSRPRPECGACLRRRSRIDGSPRRFHTLPDRPRRGHIAHLDRGRTRASSGRATKTRAADARALGGGRSERIAMKIVVIGGSGLIARRILAALFRIGWVEKRSGASAKAVQVNTVGRRGGVHCQPRPRRHPRLGGSRRRCSDRHNPRRPRTG